MTLSDADGSCSYCCSRCRHPSHASSASSPSDHPFALPHLLPAGTITLSLSWDESCCDHAHVEDGWHHFCGDKISPRLIERSQADTDLCQHLDFLILHKFLSVTCTRVPASNLAVCRIYIIPYDLSNVQGRLRHRDELLVVKPAQKFLREILPRIVQDGELWLASITKGIRKSRQFLNFTSDTGSLSSIYDRLPSPQIDQFVLSNGDEATRALVQRVAFGQPIDCLRSHLYPYQRRTISVMLMKETQRSCTPDPLYIPLRGLDGAVFYFQPGTMEFLRECPMADSDQGGILCEELGTGKTVMILALVLATVDQLPKPEESFHDPRPVLTPVAFRHFPGAPFEEARKKLSKQRGARADDSKGVPSLVEGLLHRIRLHPGAADVRHNRDWLDDRRLGKLLDLNAPFYFHWNPPDPTSSRSRRAVQKQKHGLGPRVVYLSSATLIIVPPNLLAQWISEIYKHCLPTLRVLSVKPEDRLPRALTLATDYDVILMNHERFAKEEAFSDTDAAHSWTPCHCPEYRSTRVPKCRCESPVSSLFQVRWKRLVVDEGHVHGTDTTRISLVANLLSVERRWLVSGTPTPDLLGIRFGSDNAEAEQGYYSGLSYPATDTPTAENTDADSEEELPLAPTDSAEDRAGIAPHFWSSQDRENLRRLGKMIVSFLRVPRFLASSQLFQSQVIQPLFAAGGPNPGAVQVLAQVMASVMVRHRIEDVEKDIVLPPLTQETVLMDLDPIAVKSYNALQAVIAINAVDSERKDQDYLFHPLHAGELKLLVANYSQLMFWHVDEKMYNVDELTNSIDNVIERAASRQNSLSDMTLLKASKVHIQSAARDVTWRAVQQYPIPEVPFIITGLSSNIFRAWSELSTVPLDWDLPAEHAGSAGLMFHYRLLKLRETGLKYPLASQERLIEYGETLAKEDAQRIALFVHHAAATKRPRTKKQHGVGQDDRETTMANEPVTQAQHKKIQEVQRVFTATQDMLIRRDSQLAVDNTETSARVLIPSLANASPLRNARILRSRSSKLDYLLNEILQHSLHEKFLVFSESKLTLAHVSEALNAVGVEFLHYTTKMTSRVREQFVMTFETSARYRVFLMELKHGSRGLNLTSATRVIFCEPVWQADVEAQAIKRVHRIGQTKPISVKTLAIRGTFEEAMMSRRAELKGEHQRASGLTDDLRMRHFIANPQFMTETQFQPIILNAPLLNQPLGSYLPTSGIVAAHPETIAAPSRGVTVTSTGDPPIKKRAIRFSDAA
ncbi:hypothetical protein FA95DRAFT_1551738 [Auriscalpium vulgare]|uniref:Uncharacterized protein n=1 Tax=Auriscalpium vulgare TaxID=40419 RepID=A0ACB8SBS4_9AGAM|nr:hypothetical protein FA95DRAFT_1551738 [Auriscalpium vulgare]